MNKIWEMNLPLTWRFFVFVKLLLTFAMDFYCLEVFRYVVLYKILLTSSDFFVEGFSASGFCLAGDFDSLATLFKLNVSAIANFSVDLVP